MNDRDGFYKQGLSIFIAVFIFILCLFTFEKTGVSRQYAIAATGISLAILWLMLTFLAGTTKSAKFFAAEKKTKSTVNALAMASTLGFPILLLDGGAMFFYNPSFWVVIATAIVIGMAFSSILLSRRFQAAGATDIGQFLARRYRDTLTARTSAIAISLAGLGMTVCSMSALAFLLSWYFAISQFFAMSLATIAVALSAVLGGAASNTRLAAGSFVLLLLAINIPLFLHALASPGFPIGQLGFGYNALTPLSELEAQLQSLGIPLLTDIIGKPSPIFEWVGSIQVLSGLIVMTAVCLFPSMLQQYAVCATPELASRSIGKSILLVGLMLASAFALMAYTKFGIYQLTLGLSLSEARVDAPFLYSWSGRETNLVVLCENVMQNENQLMTACLGKDQHILNTSDLQLNSRLLFAAAPDLNALPFAYTSFLSAAILLALISFSSGIILSTSNSIISAFYATLPGKVASARIFFTRLLIVGLSLFGAFLGLANPTDPGLLFMFSLSILAATLAPAMIAAVLMPSSTSVQATTGISMGFVICVLYYVLSKFGIDFTAGTGDEVSAKLPFMSEAIPSELGAILAIPIATLIVISMAGFSASTKVVPLESEDRLADH